MALSSRALVLVLAFSSAVQGNANTFLGKRPNLTDTTPLLEALEQVLSSGARTAASHVRSFELALRPIFKALPQDPDGGVAPEGVRYALHRLFVERHGWFVRGLETGGEAWNSSSPAAMFASAVGGEAARSLLEARLQGRSFGVEHTAVLAAVLESLVRQEAAERLATSYRLMGLPLGADLQDEETVNAAIDTYMLMYVLGANSSNATSSWLHEQRATIDMIYPLWGRTKEWAHSVRRGQVRHVGEASALRSFDAVLTAVEQIGNRYGRWQNFECEELKQSLLVLEEADTGRVRLDNFYRSALDGNWQFSESIAYLRQLGALDESDPERPSVIIANYINSPSNCVASSKFYSVCCIDECEALLARLEVGVAAPKGPVVLLAQLTAALASATVKAPRELPRPLVQRLEEIALQNGGSVSLHSRLFAQWLHHAFPRECPFPHLSGTTQPLTPAAWMHQTGESCTADEEEMRWRAGLDPARSEAPAELPWSVDDELFVRPPPVVVPPHRAAELLRSAALLAAAFSTALALLRSLQGALQALEEGAKFSV